MSSKIRSRAWVKEETRSVIALALEKYEDDKRLNKPSTELVYIAKKMPTLRERKKSLYMKLLHDSLEQSIIRSETICDKSEYLISKPVAEFGVIANLN
ncbi:MAG: hypothetical protein WC795_01945 [Candidatus Paceibacterota bacterium]|jgi:hypothetical protein